MPSGRNTSESRSILVLGAGELGLPVLRNLARLSKENGRSKISVLLREGTIRSQASEKKRLVEEMHTLGIAIVPGDLVDASIDDLAQMFSAYDTVIGCTGYAAGRETPMKVAKAAIQSGISRYFPWQFGVDFDAIGRGGPQDLFDAQLDVRDLLRSQDTMEWVIISTGMFTSYLFEPDFGVVDLQTHALHALGSMDNAVTLTTPEDIGALTAQIVFFEPRIRNEIVYLAGDTVTYGEFQQTLEKFFGRTFDSTVWSVPRLMEELAQDPQNMIKKYRAAFAHGKGVSWQKDETFNHRQGLHVASVEDWMQDNLAK